MYLRVEPPHIKFGLVPPPPTNPHKVWQKLLGYTVPSFVCYSSLYMDLTHILLIVDFLT